ncbi:uncharacterized protein ARMOST_07448 [Armillaria ostoyae]|uniref:Uncharacterized protein n=1 Tax=Armillaria ostoyae TaxID=47428 RepID=A0A284R5V1_ARMOS|nr:uncharacterized protein ARMOST_07448 [Armillaria ostoyae]
MVPLTASWHHLDSDAKDRDDGFLDDSTGQAGNVVILTCSTVNHGIRNLSYLDLGYAVTDHLDQDTRVTRS